MTKQYENSGPVRTPEHKGDQEIVEKLKLVDAQTKDLKEALRRIEDLEKDIRKIKSKLDIHASAISKKQ